MHIPCHRKMVCFWAHLDLLARWKVNGELGLFPSFIGVDRGRGGQGWQGRQANGADGCLMQGMQAIRHAPQALRSCLRRAATRPVRLLGGPSLCAVVQLQWLRPHALPLHE